MRIIGVALGCALLAGVTACGGGGGVHGAPDGRTELARARKALAEAEAGELTLDFTDRAETGWRSPFRPADQDCGHLFDLAEGRPPALSDQSSSALSERPPSSPSGVADDQATAPPDAVRPSAFAPSAAALGGGAPWTAAASFLGGHLGETAGVVVAAYPSRDAPRAMRAVADLMRHCSVASAKAPGGGDRLVASELPVGTLADGAEARRFKGRVSGYPYEMHLVVVRSGGVLVSLVHAGLAKLDAEKTRRLAGVLADKVREAAE